jgi:RNase P/RNase MRP subunit p29
MKEELIGKKVTIIFNQKLHKGTIINETKNMIYLKNIKNTKKFIKNTIKITYDDKIIDGKEIIKRPQDRIKR